MDDADDLDDADDVIYGGAAARDDADDGGGDVDDPGVYDDDDGQLDSSEAGFGGMHCYSQCSWPEQWQPCLFTLQACGRNLPSPLLLKARRHPQLTVLACLLLV